MRETSQLAQAGGTRKYNKGGNSQRGPRAGNVQPMPSLPQRYQVMSDYFTYSTFFAF